MCLLRDKAASGAGWYCSLLQMLQLAGSSTRCRTYDGGKDANQLLGIVPEGWGPEEQQWGKLRDTQVLASGAAA